MRKKKVTFASELKYCGRDKDHEVFKKNVRKTLIL